MVISNTRELEKLKDRIPNLINIARIAIVFPPADYAYLRVGGQRT